MVKGTIEKVHGRLELLYRYKGNRNRFLGKESYDWNSRKGT